jgi:transmembrane sensor
MNERVKRMAALAARIQPDLDPTDTARRVERIDELARMRARRRAVAAGITVVVSAAALALLVRAPESRRLQSESSAPPAELAPATPSTPSAAPVSTAPAEVAGPEAPATPAASPTREPPARVDTPARAPARSVEKLLVAADVARLSDRPRDAIRDLRRALALDPDPPREAVAAFTLGKVLLEELGDAEPAAEAFARARSAEPDGPLAEDALAREVEAWSRAGAEEIARLRAEEYLRIYPAGRRAREVRKFGGIGD